MHLANKQTKLNSIIHNQRYNFRQSRQHQTNIATLQTHNRELEHPAFPIALVRSVAMFAKCRLPSNVLHDTAVVLTQNGMNLVTFGCIRITRSPWDIFPEDNYYPDNYAY